MRRVPFVSAVVLLAALCALSSAPVPASAMTVGSYSGEVGPNLAANRIATTSLQTSWLSAVAAAGGTANAPILLTTSGPITGVIHTAGDGTTVSVQRLQYRPTPVPTLTNSPNPGTGTCSTAIQVN